MRKHYLTNKDPQPLKNIKVSKFSSFLEEKYYPLWVALNHHRTHTNKQLTLNKHHYLKEILMDKSNHRVLKKSTQGGMSECLIVIAWSAAIQGKVVFYVMPTDGLKNRFVSNRFEKSMLYGKYYKSEMTRLKNKNVTARKNLDNLSLKDVGKGVINFAGSQSDVPFVEIPADWFIVDEADNCDAKRLNMGIERLGHSSDPHQIYVGNPTFIGSFLDDKYNKSTMSKWHIKHDCGHFIQVDFFKHVVEQINENDFIIRDKDFEFGGSRDIYPICDKCNNPFDRYSYGTYVDQKKSHISGKHFSRLFSGNSSLVDLVGRFSDGLANDYKMQRFYNSDLGESYTAEGAKISNSLIEACTEDYLLPSQIKEGVCVLGADVGSVIHVRINKMLPDGRKQAVFIDTVQTLPELLSLCGRYKVVAAVIDALPELRLARGFSHSSPGFFRSFFGGDKSDSVNLTEKTITISRLLAIDNMKEDFITKKYLFPKNICNFEEYMNHIQEPTRIWNDEKKVYQWVSNRPDHFFFAETYCKLAEKILKFMK